MYTPMIDRPANGGTQKIYRFRNGYGASLVQHQFSYGLEMAVLIFNEEGKYRLCYSTPITNDVLGHLEESEIQPLLKQIDALPRMGSLRDLFWRAVQKVQNWMERAKWKLCRR